MDNPKGIKKIVHAGDAYFCCHEPQEIGYLDLAESKNGIKLKYLWLLGQPNMG